MKTSSMRERLIVGLDLPSVKEAERAVHDLDGITNFYKIGYQLAFSRAGCRLRANWRKAAPRCFST